ncbi:EAL domain-containing protein [Thiomicrorhabdus sp.]|uniref:EAL domain-containing protein n=1 Tax=Thiomicrorhabdus sp. TaxID=2039724 RepID=UPI002AA7F25B|nr:EAL domain-containing protein [Thiomicrorhabdus sp.]
MKEYDFLKEFSTDNFETIFNLSKDGIAIISLETNFLKCNPAYLQITGFSSETLLNQTLYDLTKPENKDSLSTVIQEVIKTGHIDNFETSLRLKRTTSQVNMALTLLPDKNHILISLQNLSEKQNLIDSLEQTVKFDALTQLPNREYFTQLFNQTCEKIKNLQNIYIGFLDLDSFKSINDLYGHTLGDELLTSLAHRLTISLEQDEAASRLGGDEFAILLLANNMEELEFRIEKLFKQLELPYVLKSSPVPVEISCSIGISQYSDEFNELDTLLRQSDHAMYLAKMPNHPNIKYFSHSEYQKTISHQKMLVKISDAIKNNEMELYYQPKVNLRTGKITGFETLIRWIDPKNGLVLPNNFLPIIESTHVIIELDRWVIKQAIAETQQRYKQGYFWPVSINISNRHFHHDSFLPFLEEALKSAPELPPNTFEIELLESIAIIDFAQAKQVLTAIKALGVNLSLDDFGTGYSSIAYLKHLPFDTVKIDKMFIQTMLSHTDEMQVVEATINLTKVFNLNVIAEGVETIEHGIVLLRYGCNQAQGFGIANPMPGKDIIQWSEHFTPDPSWSLWADALWDTRDFPLLVAKSDHIIWIEQVLLTMRDANIEPDLTQLKDEYSCRFGQWYYGIGKQQYSHLPIYQKIESIHQEVHHVGLEMYELKQSGDIHSAKELIEHLLDLRDQILTALDQLQRQFIKQNTPKK